MKTYHKILIEYEIPIIALILVVYVLFSTLLVSCNNSSKSLKDYAIIEVIDVEGMACVIYKVSNSGGISCNWDEWEND